MNAAIIFLLSCLSYLFADKLWENPINCMSVRVIKVCPDDKISYWLDNSQASAYRLDLKDNNTLLKAPFIPNVKTVFLLNGFNGTRETYINKDLIPAYLSRGYNVISLDYYPLMPLPCYVKAVANTKPIARCFTEFFRLLLKLKKFSLSRAHVIGFSLGAQIAGKAGKYLIDAGITLPRVTDAVHTNSLVFGKMLDVGHVDFYVNDIVHQPQCVGIHLAVLCPSYSFASKFLQNPINCTFVSTKNVCPNDGISYWLYNSQVSGYRLDLKDNNTLSRAPFIPNVKTKFIVPGYNGTKDSYINKDLRPPYLRKGYNVISLDYFPLAPIPCYTKAVANADPISRCFAELFKILLHLKKFSLSQSHLIGFSLGGQIVGKVGKYLIKAGITLPRVTGLDPAAPLFYGRSSYIDKNSATFVDSIHTNSLLLGKLLPIGHADFYVNDIVYQPQCVGLNPEDLMICSHLFSTEIFTESILQKHVFCGKPLKGVKKERMGEYVSISARGIYTVKTNKQYPYARSTTC